MIEIHPLRDKVRLSELYTKHNVDFTNDSIAIVASDGDEVLGCCLFDLNVKNGTIHHIEPVCDVMFADGLLRSALYVCVENNVDTVFYSENAPISLFERLQFIKDSENRELDVTKLFNSCKSC